MNSETSGIDYVAVLADLRARRAQIDAAIAGIETLLGQSPGPVWKNLQGNGTKFSVDCPSSKTGTSRENTVAREYVI